MKEVKKEDGKGGPVGFGAIEEAGADEMGRGGGGIAEERLFNGRISEIVRTYICWQIYESAFLLKWGKLPPPPPPPFCLLRCVCVCIVCRLLLLLRSALPSPLPPLMLLLLLLLLPLSLLLLLPLDSE